MTCIICQSPVQSFPAMIGGFISEFVLEAPVAATNLHQCLACGLRFFERRYSDAEMHRLYDGYRGERYFEIRHRHEPWYTRRLNDMTMASVAVLRDRKAGLAALMARHCPEAQSLLDYGGDRGQFIPDRVKEKFVFDYADVTPVPGVSKLDRLGTRTFDCVLVLNVLEHVSDPLSELQKISGLIAPGGTLIVSVPDEYPAILPGYSICARLVRSLALRSRFVATAVDLFSKFMKFKLDIFPPLSLVSQNEHLNFYTPQSLAKLAGRGRILDTGVAPEPDGVFRRSLFLVARF